MRLTKSPFPGMDPYVERKWGGFHTRLSVNLADGLNVDLPGDLFAEVEERVYVERLDTTSSRPTSYSPDVFVYEKPDAARGATAMLTPAATTRRPAAVPTLVRFPLQHTERFIQIRERATGQSVVTVIELISPSNRMVGEGRRQYRRKQRDCIASRTNLVELDLVRVGRPG